MADNKLKPIFGNKSNIDEAKKDGTVDNYDLLLLDDGEVAWIDGEGNTVFGTPRTQNEIVFSNGTVIEAGKTMDELVEIFAKMTSGKFIEL